MLTQAYQPSAPCVMPSRILRPHPTPRPSLQAAATSLQHPSQGWDRRRQSIQRRAVRQVPHRATPLAAAQHCPCRSQCLPCQGSMPPTNVQTPMEASSSQRGFSSVPRPGTAPALEAQRAPMSAPGSVTAPAAASAAAPLAASASLGFPVIPSPRQAPAEAPQIRFIADSAGVSWPRLGQRSSPAGRGPPAAAPKQAASPAKGVPVPALGAAASSQQPSTLAAAAQASSGIGHSIFGDLAP